MKKIPYFFLMLITILSFLTPFVCYADTRNDNVIRVCYYPLNRATTEHTEHPYHAYYYDYLQEICQYTGWTYEYIDASYEECLEMLANKEIDLICGIDKTEKHLAQMDFSTRSVMTAKYKLYTTADNNTFYYNDYAHFDGMKIGIVNGCGQTASIDTLFNTHNITMQKVYFDTGMEMEEALLSGEIDALFATEVSDNSQLRVIHHFPSTMLYFATWYGNDILTEIAEAQNLITNIVTNFEYDLYQSSIGSTKELCPFFTREELEYIQEHPTVVIGADPYWAPIESTDPETGELYGITAEILKLLEESTGLTFEYNASESFSETIEKLQNGEIEMLTALSHDYAWAEQNQVNLSAPYLNSSIVMIYDTTKNNEYTSVALPRNFNITQKIVDMNAYDDILYYDTAEKCIEAVANGIADCTYTNNCIGNYYLSNVAYRSLSATKLSSISENLCFAVSKDADFRLLSIINKGLACIPAEKIEAIVLEYTLYDNEFSLRTLIYAYPEAVIIVLIIFFGILLTGLLIAFVIHYRKARMLKTISQTDSLTGILNRGAVQAQITLTLEKEKNLPGLICPLIAVDLDNFKAVNDTYGHTEGDLLLKAVSQVLKHSVRQIDIVGRIGGDEFVVYLTNITNKKTAEKVVAKLCTAISAISLEKEEWSDITASFGVAFGDSKASWDSLYHQADIALYDAKQKGKNRYSIYEQENDSNRNLP